LFLKEMSQVPLTLLPDAVFIPDVRMHRISAAKKNQN